MPNAKLARPRYTEVLPRERLFRRLDAGAGVTWISAPPGAGKTTLASSYVDARELRHLWFQLDAGDADPATFFHYLGLAAGGGLPHLTAEYLGGLDVFARRFFETLASRLPGPCVLVLDNYHEIPVGAPLHELLAEGLARLPPGFAVIVLSRTPPPSELAPIVGDVLRWEDLQLTLDEVSSIERLRRGERAGAVSHVELHGRTQGWAAGLTLLLEQKDGAALSRPLAEASPQALFDYFGGEVFSALALETQRVLLESALLPKPTAETLGELTGNARAIDVLEELYRKNYFTLKHLGSGTYEYHPLFRQFLSGRARSLFKPLELKALQQKAAALLDAHGQAENAAELLHSAGDFASLAELIRREAPRLIEQGRSQVVERWLAHLPAGLARRDPWLCYWHGLCRLPFNPTQSRAHFEQAYELFLAAADLAGVCMAWCAVVDSFVFEWGNFAPLGPWIDAMEKLRLEHPRLPSPELAAQVDCGLFVALMYLRPEHPDMPALEARVREIILHGQDPRLPVKFGNHLLIYYTWWTGDLAKAEALVETLRTQIEKPGVPPLVQITWHAMAAGYFWMSADNARCLECVERGLELGRSSGVHTWDMLLCSQGHFGSLSADQRATAADYLRRMEMLLNMSRPLDTAIYYYHAAWYRLAHGNYAGAREFAETALGMADSAGARFPAAVMRNDLGRVLHYLGDEAGSRALIHQARAEGRAMNAQTIEYLTFIAEAEIALADGDEEQCVAHLRRAFAVGRVQQFRNHTWWWPQVMSALYAKALEHGVEVEYVRRVIALRHLPPPEDMRAPALWPWPLRIRTRARFSVVRDGEPVALEGKRLELLQALVALGARNVQQSALIAAVWPGMEPQQAQAALDISLQELRCMLGSESLLVAKGTSVTLDPGQVWIDCFHERTTGLRESAKAL